MPGHLCHELCPQACQPGGSGGAPHCQLPRYAPPTHAEGGDLSARAAVRIGRSKSSRCFTGQGGSGDVRFNTKGFVLPIKNRGNVKDEANGAICKVLSLVPGLVPGLSCQPRHLHSHSHYLKIKPIIMTRYNRNHSETVA